MYGILLQQTFANLDLQISHKDAYGNFIKNNDKYLEKQRSELQYFLKLRWTKDRKHGMLFHVFSSIIEKTWIFMYVMV